MKKKAFWVLVFCFLAFTFVAHAADEAANVVGSAPEGSETQAILNTDDVNISTKQLVTTSDDDSFNLTKKNVISPKTQTISLSQFTPALGRKLNVNTGTDTGKANSMFSAKATGGPGTTPNGAIEFPIGAYYTGHLTPTETQHWFYVRASQSGQMTVHLDVPESTNIDYDLYVYRLDQSTGKLSTFQGSVSTRYAKSNEHVSFITDAGYYYYIHVPSYQGNSTKLPYYLNVEMASQGVREVDDFPENAFALPIDTLGTTGSISMRTDEDFYKFTATDYRVLIIFGASNTNVIADFYQQNGTNLNHLGYLDVEPKYGKNQTAYYLNVSKGTTYYLRVRNMNNKVFGSSSYEISVNCFYCPETIAQHLGRSIDGTRIAYVTNRDTLYVNSTPVMSGLSSNCNYSYDSPNYSHKSSASSPVDSVNFVTYIGDVTIPNALGILIRSAPGDLGVRYDNKKTGYDKNGNATSLYENGYTNLPSNSSQAAFVLDLSDGKIKDFASNVGNGVYNGFWDNRSFSFIRQ